MDVTKYLLIGGGPTAVWASIGIRERDPDGRIVLVSNEFNPPTDKVPLSKQFLIKDDWTREDPESKARDFYSKNKIDLRLGANALSIDRASRTVTLDNGSGIQYEQLLLATGATPRKLDVPGADLASVHYLRHLDDADAIRRTLKSTERGVVIGAGYIGVEIAAACVARGVKVDVIDPAIRPWAKFASEVTGAYIQRLFESHGVTFHFGDSAAVFQGDKSIERVITQAGKTLDADFVVVGIGVSLNTELAKAAELTVDDKEGIVTDAFLRTSDPNIWAAGDIAYFDDRVTGARWHIEHHQNAKWQGKAVGENMAGANAPYERVAYFFSDMFDIHMNLRGCPRLGKHLRTLGDVDGGEFVDLYADEGGWLTMTLAVSHDDPKLDGISDRAEELLKSRALAAELNEQSFGL